MNIETPEGALSIEDNELRFVPVDNGPELKVSLNPMPEYKYERGVYGLGTLVVGTGPEAHVIVLNNEQASAVVEELRRPRGNANKARKTDGDSATAK